MADLINGESNMPPNFFGGSAGGNRYSNPFYGVPFQYLPHNIDMQLWWANHFLVRFPFYRAVLSRVSSYFITSLKIECDDPEAKKRYEEIFEEMEYKQKLARLGLDLLAYGNAFATISQGFDRFLQCPHCQRISSIRRLFDYDFTKEGQYVLTCANCKTKGQHEVIDKPNKDLKKLEVIFWDPREITVRHDKSTNTSEYYWDIPQSYSTMVTKPNNKFYSKVTPKPVFDAIYKKRQMGFNNKNFIHLKVPTPSGMPNTGKAIPFCIYMFDDFFMLKVLERYNQALMFEDIVPFRVFSMAQQGSGNQQINPIIHQSAPQWTAAIKRMIQEHRKDPGGYAMFPFQFQYEHLGGDAKNLAPTELIQNTIGNILNALNVPQELYTMTLQTQALSPALRLFENSWSFLIDLYNNMLEQWSDIVSKIQGLPKAKIMLQPVTISDDIERKSIIAQLVQANAIARSELLSMYGIDYRDQVRKKMEEDEIAKELQEEQAMKDQVRQLSESGQGQQAGGTTPGDVLSKAQEIAAQLKPLDGAQRRQQLQQIKAQDATLYAAVKAQLDEMTSQDASQGVQQGKQQGQQGQ